MIFDTDILYLKGAKHLAAEIILISLQDLESPNFSLREKAKSNIKTLAEKKELRELAFDWFQNRSDQPFGYLWCLSLSEQNGALIRHAVNWLYHQNKSLKSLKIHHRAY